MLGRLAKDTGLHVSVLLVESTLASPSQLLLNAFQDIKYIQCLRTQLWSLQLRPYTVQVKWHTPEFKEQ